MSDQEREATIDDVWVNRLAAKIGMLSAQNERLMLEIEVLQDRLQKLEDRHDHPAESNQPSLNGEMFDEIPA